MTERRFERRVADVKRLYCLLDELEEKLGGKRTLAQCTGRLSWPDRGVYFFYEPGEVRTTSGFGPRVVRVGTHALKTGSKSTLWQRLRQHRGTLSGKYPGGGNHRGSIFRLHLGTALIAKHELTGKAVEMWGVGSSSPTEHTRDDEYPLERGVSEHIRSMPFLWIGIEDEPGPESLRGTIEGNAVALLSNYNTPSHPIDPPSDSWLGRWAANEAIRRSGLWNVNYVSDAYHRAFLEQLQALIRG